MTEPPRPTPPAAEAAAPVPNGFAKAVAAANGRLGDQLAGAEITAGDKKLTIVVPAEKAFVQPMLQLGSAEIAKHAQAYFGRRLEVEVRISGNYAPPPERKAGPAAKRRSFDSPAEKERKREAMNHAAVQETLRVFDSGRIIEVHLLADATLLEQADPQEQE